MSHYPGGRGAEDPPIFPIMDEKVGLGLESGNGGGGIASRRGSQVMSLGLGDLANEFGGKKGKLRMGKYGECMNQGQYADDPGLSQRAWTALGVIAGLFFFSRILFRMLYHSPTLLFHQLM
jgi:hypothetical protein